MRRRIARWLLILIIAVLGHGTIGVHTQAVSPPILLITNSAAPNPFGGYLGEILRAEGLNQFAAKDLAAVTGTDLANTDLVVLAETPLTGTQANLLSNYVAGGGRLVAMRPDDQLAPVLGLTPAGSSVNEGYFAINSATAFADGFPTTTLPFHGQANTYTAISGSTALATLYSDATTATSFPAVIKSGRTATWAYDLARSVVYTRQGNPANASDRDGQPPYRTEDLFYGAIDRDKVNIPYADVQMRMLGRVISDLLTDVMPLPRLWYFPGSNRTLMVITSDSHANPQSYFDRVASSVAARGGHVSFYIYNGGDPSAAQIQTWRANGNEVGMHPAAFQFNRSIDAAIVAAEDYFTAIGGGLPSPTTRLHQIEWQGWVDAAKIEANHGVGLDTSFYTWGPAVTYPGGNQAHGYINGSGLPMRFIDAAGAIVPVYQQVTSVIDEQLIIGSFSEQLSPDQALVVTRQLIDNSQAGGYSAITTQFHVDYFGFGEVQPWAEGTMDYAQSLGIPMWTAERWLNYTTARAATTMTGFSWAPGTKELSFTVTVPAAAEPQSVALPGAAAGFGVSSVLVDGSPASTVQQAISGRATTFVSIGPGTHAVAVTYATPIPPPEHPPVAHADSANVTEAHTAVIPVLANDTDADGDALTVVSTTPDSGAVITINADQTISYTPNPGTCGVDTFSYSIDDGRGGTATADVTVTVTCLNGQVTHSTVADLAPFCAVPAGTIVTRVANGELRLAGTQGDEYSQAALDSSKWIAGTWSGGAYTPSLTGGTLSLSNTNGAFVRSVSALPITTLESSVRFSGLPWEHVGWASLNFGGGYAIFSTYSTTTSLFARTSQDGSSEQQTNLGSIPSGFHTYRIERQVISPTSNIVNYYVDGVLRAQHSVGTLAPMYVYQSHSGGTAQTLDIDRIWVYPPYTGSGTYQSCTMDIGHTLSSWTTADWSAAAPSGTTLRLRTRTSSDGTAWSGWSAPLTASGQDITSPAGRYLQYLAEFTTTDSSQSPVLDSVTMRFADNAVPREHSPIALSDAASTSENSAITVDVLPNDSDPDNDPISVVSVTQGAKGAVAINTNQTITYTPNPGSCGTDTFTYTISDGRGGTASTSVSINIACVSGRVTHATVADFGPSCSVSSNAIVSRIGDGEIRLAGVQGDEFTASTLDPALWVAGTWSGGAYAPAPSGGVLSIADANGAYVRSASSMAVTTLEASARFTGLPFQHVGWGSLDFSGGYAMFSTYDTNTTLFARTNSGSGEQQTNLGPIPSGFHVYRVERQSAAPGSDVVSYYVDSLLVAQHTVGTLGPMHVYVSHNGGTAQTLDVDRIWVYPTYRDTGSFQSCTMDGGSNPFTWTTATWSANVPNGTALQLSTRTSPDGTTWSPWSPPALSSGQGISSPANRYLQYLLELTTTDSALSPVVDSVTMGLRLGSVDSVPPVLSNITASNITSSSAVISWTTDEAATSGVQYGPTRAYGFETTASSLVTAHSQLLTGLAAGTTYNYRVISRDSAGNESDSQNFTFVTAVPSLSIGNVSVAEGNAGSVNATFTVSMSAPSNQSVTVSYATAPGTATPPSDYTSTSGTLTFAPGITSLPINVTVNGDTQLEANETFFVNLSGATNATIATAQGVGTIVNDDASVPTLSINNVTVAEGNAGTSTATFTVSLSAASSQTVTVNYATADGTATSGSDYVAASGTLTFPPGTTSASLPVAVNGDTQLEVNETFFVNLSGASNATIADAQGIGTISNDDAQPTLSINDVTVTEGNAGTSTATFTVSLSAASGQTVTVNYATADGTATSGSDYVAASGTLTFPPGTTSASLPVAVNGDTQFEVNETFFVNLSGASNATIATAQGIGTISNDDAQPTLSINDVTVTEGNSGTSTATFTVSLSAASGQTVTVGYATANGTATAGSDYAAATGTLTFAAGTTNQSVAVTVSGDTTLEPNETFLVNLSSPTNATIADSQGLGTILNNDPPAIAINNVSVTEGTSGTVNATFAVTLSQPTTQTVTVNYATANGTATSGSDYVAKSGTLTFPAGTTSTSLTVVVNGDQLSEPNETFVVNLSGATNATIASAQGVGTILNDDPLPTLSINDVTVTEGNSGNPSATFTVSLSAASGQTVTVNYATANGTATSGIDYTATSGTLTFSAGTTTRTFTVTTIGDTTPEADETFVVNLSSASNVTIADAQGIGTIVDNDGTMTVTAPNTAVTWQPGTTQTITWTNNLGSSAAVRLELSRDGGNTWSVLAASVQNSSASGGAFNWTVTTPTTTTARVRATWTANSNVTDSSDVNFTIAGGTITVTSPNGGETWGVGTSATVNWSSSLPTSDNVRIELSTDGGASYAVLLASSTPNDGNASFTVQSAWKTAKGRIRVTSLTSTSVNDASNSNFKIQ